MAWAIKVELMMGPMDGAIVDIGDDATAGECFRVSHAEGEDGSEAIYSVIPGTTYDDKTPEGRIRAKFSEMIREEPQV